MVNTYSSSKSLVGNRLCKDDVVVFSFDGRKLGHRVVVVDGKWWLGGDDGLNDALFIRMGLQSDVGTASSYRRVASLCAYMYGMEKCTGAWPEADSERGLRRLVKFLFELTEGKPFPERLRLLLDI